MYHILPSCENSEEKAQNFELPSKKKNKKKTIVIVTAKAKAKAKATIAARVTVAHLPP